jgi:transcriptional regulator with XRE-family HTH domain
MSTPKSLADVIRAEVKRQGWTAYRLAKEHGISEPTARRFLNAQHDPSLSNVEKLLDAIGWTIAPKGRKS